MHSLDELVNHIINEPMLSGETYVYLILGTKNSYTSGYFAVSGDEVSYDGKITIALFDKYNNQIEEFMLGKGILCVKVDAGRIVDQGIVNDMNPELFDSDVLELIIYQRYGLEPDGQERKETLQKSLKAEKIKDTLVFACYMNDMDKIKERAGRARKSDLDKVLEYSGTSLQFCSKHDNLEAFRLLAEKGANVGKRALTQTPLELAFRYSSDIVNYMSYAFPEVYQKEVKKKGFSISYHCKDEALLKEIFMLGCDVNQERKPFPPLHNFADYNNATGIKFLLAHGANVDCRNEYKQTALHRAIMRRNVAATEMLLEHGADVQAADRDGKTPVDLAKTCENEVIYNMLLSGNHIF